MSVHGTHVRINQRLGAVRAGVRPALPQKKTASTATRNSTTATGPSPAGAGDQHAIRGHPPTLGGAQPRQGVLFGALSRCAAQDHEPEHALEATQSIAEVDQDEDDRG